MSQEQKECHCTPRLRFPEFVECKSWLKTKINNIASERLSNGIFNDPSKRGAGYYIINVKDMYLTTPIYDDCLQEIALSNGEFKNKVSYGDIFFTRSSLVSSGIAHSNIYLGNSENITFDDHLIRLRVKKTICLPLFVHFALKTNSICRYLQACGKTATMTTISQEDISNSIIYITSIEEQQKIADCLTSLDDLITAHEQKAEALRQHKKGLMQRLLPAEGETTPRWRFPEFREAEEWSKELLGNLVSVAMCKRIFAEETNPLEGVPFYKIGTLGSAADSFISYELFNTYRNKYNYPEKGEILITCSGTIGKIVRHSGEDAYYQDSNIVWLKNDQRNVINNYLFYFFEGFNWEKLNSTTITRIYGDDLRNILLCFPPKKKEQQKIADCLSSLDERIAAQEAKVAALREHKKGLIQQLFPQ